MVDSNAAQARSSYKMKLNKALLRQKAKVQSDLREVDYGEAVYDRETTVACRFVRVSKMTMGPSGSLESVDAEMLMGSTPLITPNDKITHDGHSFKVYKLAEGRDGSGRLVSQVVTLQTWRD